MSPTLRVPLTVARRRALAVILGTATLVLPLLSATPAMASGPLYRLWTLSGVTFQDGGTLSGTLVIQSDGTPVYFDVTTAGGDTVTFGTYNYTGTPSPLSGDGPTFGWYMWTPGLVGQQYLNLKLPDTTGATTGTSLPIAPNPASWECGNCSPIRYVTAGSMVAGGAAGAATSVSLSSDHNPAGLGGTVTFTATVSSRGGTPSGQVTFRDMTTSTDLCSGYLDLAGVATCSWGTSALGLGRHSIRASFAPTPYFQPGADSLGQVITKAATSVSLRSSPQPSTYRQAVHLVAKVSTSATGLGTPTGSMDFLYRGTKLCFDVPVDSHGKAVCDLRDGIDIGPNLLAAIYSGDSSFQPSTSPIHVHGTGPAVTTTVVTASPASVAAGQKVTLTARVSNVLLAAGSYPLWGKVQFWIDGTKVTPQVALKNGQASLTVDAPLTRGSHHVHATYIGIPDYVASTSPGTLLFVK
jgi:hypothetical protein